MTDLTKHAEDLKPLMSIHQRIEHYEAMWRLELQGEKPSKAAPRVNLRGLLIHQTDMSETQVEEYLNEIEAEEGFKNV